MTEFQPIWSGGGTELDVFCLAAPIWRGGGTELDVFCLAAPVWSGGGTELDVFCLAAPVWSGGGTELDKAQLTQRLTGVQLEVTYVAAYCHHKLYTLSTDLRFQSSFLNEHQ